MRTCESNAPKKKKLIHSSSNSIVLIALLHEKSFRMGQLRAGAAKERETFKTGFQRQNSHNSVKFYQKNFGQFWRSLPPDFIVVRTMVTRNTK